MMGTIFDWLSGLLLVAGGFFVLVGGVGVIRMPDLYTRIHAASVTETLGTMLILTGLMLHSGWELATFKLLAILVFFAFYRPCVVLRLGQHGVARWFKA
uniref:cation:proton antiporter n=1 Tax=Orrella sp. TaxID=1921583 RepID=UPI004048C689